MSEVSRRGPGTELQVDHELGSNPPGVPGVLTWGLGGERAEVMLQLLPGLPREKVLGAVIRLMDLTLIRIGK